MPVAWIQVVFEIHCLCAQRRCHFLGVPGWHHVVDPTVVEINPGHITQNRKSQR